MASRTFEQWIDGIFDHPVTEPAWFWDADADQCVEDDKTNVAYLARACLRTRIGFFAGLMMRRWAKV